MGAATFEFGDTTDSTTGTYTREPDATGSGAPGSDPPVSGMAVLILSIQIILIAIILVSNGLILAAIKKSSKLHKMTFYLLGNVAVADGSFAFSYATRFFLKDRFDGYGCVICNFFMMLSCGSSLSCVLFTCVHNFVSVKFFAYAKNGFSDRTVKFIIAGIWVFWVMFAGLSVVTADVTVPNPGNICYLGNMYYSFAWMRALDAICISQFSLVLVLQVWTIAIVRKHKVNLQAQLQEQINTAANSTKLRNAQRAARMTGIITFVLILTLISWGPVLCTSVVSAVCPTSCGITPVVWSISGIFLFINNIGNVFIYALKSEEFRDAVRKVFRRDNSVTSSVATTTTEGQGF